MKRRGCLLVVVGLMAVWLGLGVGPTARADGGAPNLAYITGAGANGDDLAVIDIAKKQMTGRVHVGGSPTGIVLSGDNRFAYVTRPASNDLAVIDAHALRVTATISTGKDPRGVAIDLLDPPGVATLYVANYGSDTVSILDADAHKTIATVPVGHHPQGVAFAGPGSGISDQFTREIYVTNTDSNTVSVISAKSHQVIATIPAPGGPTSIVIPAFDGVAYVATRSGAILALGLADHRLLGTLLQANGAQFGLMDYDALTAQVYVPDSGNNVVDVLAPATASAGTAKLPSEPARTLPYPKGPAAVAITGDGALGFIAQAGNGQVEMFDVATRQRQATFAVGGAPRAIITGAYPPALDRTTANITGFIISGLVLIIILGIVAYIVLRVRRQGASSHA